MRTFIIPLFILLMLCPELASCSTEEPDLPPSTEQPTVPDPPPTGDKPDEKNDENNSSMNNPLNIRIGTSTFTITLESNATAKAFAGLLPLTLNMAEMNGNEKYFNLSANLPTAASRPETIRAGDLMLYGSNTLVLFYETFSSSYSYTRLGHVDNPSALADALGRGSVSVIFERK